MQRHRPHEEQDRMFQKLYKPSPSSSLEKKFTEVFTPSGAVKSGFARTTPRDEVPPTELNGSMIGTGVPYAGVLVYRAAPTDIAPAAFACPMIVEFPFWYSLISISPRKTTYLNFIGVTVSCAQVRTIMMLASTSAFTTNGKTSIGSPQLFFC